MHQLQRTVNENTRINIQDALENHQHDNISIYVANGTSVEMDVSMWTLQENMWKTKIPNGFMAIEQINCRHTLSMLVAEGRLSHVAELDGAFATAVHEQVAVDRVEFSCSNDLCQLLHVHGLDIHNV